MTYCGSPRKKGRPPCRRPAGWGTDHVGVGRCKLHGGRTPIKHGRYSKIPRARLGAELAEVANDPNPLDLVPELELLRAQLLKLVRGKKAADPARVTEIAESVSRVAKRMHEMQEARPLTMATFRRLQEAMAAIVAENVRDLETLRRIESGWRERIRL